MDIKGINMEYALPQQAAWQEPEIKKKNEPNVKPVEESQLEELKASGQDGKEKLQEELINQKALEKLAKEAKEALEGLNRSIRFSISKDTGDIVVQIIDKKTKEVLKQIPPEELIKLKVKLREICGILFDRKV